MRKFVKQPAPTGLVHELKIWPIFFNALINGKKPFEIRKMDRDYQVGDYIRFREYAKKDDEYTGREVNCIITYVCRKTDYMQTGFGVLGIKMIEEMSNQEYLKQVEADMWLWAEDAAVKFHVEQMIKLTRNADDQIQQDRFFRLHLRKKLDLLLHKLEPALKAEVDAILQTLGKKEMLDLN